MVDFKIKSSSLLILAGQGEFSNIRTPANPTISVCHLQWEKLQMTTSERRKIVCSVTFHIIAITCVVWSLYVLIDRTAEEIKQGNDNGECIYHFLSLCS